MENAVRVRKVCSVKACFGDSNEWLKMIFNRAVYHVVEQFDGRWYLLEIIMCPSRETDTWIDWGWTYSNRAPQAVLCATAVEMFGWQTQVGTWVKRLSANSSQFSTDINYFQGHSHNLTSLISSSFLDKYPRMSTSFSKHDCMFVYGLFALSIPTPAS